MKLGQLTEYNNSNIFFKHYAENKPRRLVPDLYEVKASGLQLSFNSFIALNLQYNKNKLYKTSNYGTIDTLNFNLPEKCLELASRPHFLFDFSIKIFLELYSIN